MTDRSCAQHKTFILGDNPLIKMFGFGMAFAVFIDATVVRMILVPGAPGPDLEKVGAGLG